MRAWPKACSFFILQSLQIFFIQDPTAVAIYNIKPKTGDIILLKNGNKTGSIGGSFL